MEDLLEQLVALFPTEPEWKVDWDKIIKRGLLTWVMAM